MTSSAWTRRDFLKRSATAGGLALGGAYLLGACGGDDGGSGDAAARGNALQQARQRGSISIGIAGERPYGFINRQGEVTGEAPEVARAVFQNLGIPELDAQVVDFNALIPGLNAFRFDVVAAGMFITPERCNRAAFSVPDYQAPSAFLVPQGNPQNVTRYEDIAQKNLQLAVLGGAVEREYALKSGVSRDQLLILDSQETLLQAVLDGRTYAASLTRISLESLVQRASGVEQQVDVTPPFNPIINGQQQVQAGGFVFREQDDALRTAFNEELNQLQRSGRWLEIVRPFGFTEANLPPRGLTTEQLCSPGNEAPLPTPATPTS